jgi:tRNA nucleotidyltransferase (CCA-adding enzyme)
LFFQLIQRGIVKDGKIGHANRPTLIKLLYFSVIAAGGFRRGQGPDITLRQSPIPCFWRSPDRYDNEIVLIVVFKKSVLLPGVEPVHHDRRGLPGGIDAGYAEFSVGRHAVLAPETLPDGALVLFGQGQALLLYPFIGDIAEPDGSETAIAEKTGDLGLAGAGHADDRDYFHTVYYKGLIREMTMFLTSCAIIFDVPEKINLARNIKEQLPADLIEFIRQAGETAQKQQQRLYLVGGAVRDLLLERPNGDLDLVVEGDAVRLAREIADLRKAKITVHNRFWTAKVKWDERSADLATARAETYTRPGALPTVKPGTISDDLSRRDFTVNAMAIELNPRRFGDIIDPHGGRQDIDAGLIRVLHDKSYIDDATRIWRALRYEQRLDFRLELATEELLKQCTAWLGTVSGDRIRHELELVLKEEMPEKTLRRADELGVMDRLHPSLKGDDWLAGKYDLARRECDPGNAPTPQLYLALLVYRLTVTETAYLISSLRLPKTTAQTLRDTMSIKGITGELAVPGLAPSLIYERLHDCCLTALDAGRLASGNATTAEHIELFLNVLRHVNPALTGEALKKMGIPEGPKIKEVLHRLREAKLDGKIDGKRGEEEMVRGLINK